MKIVVIGGTGLIGGKLAARLRTAGHEVLAASPRNGVNAVTGEGLVPALAGAEVLVDVSNSPSFAPDAVLAFFDSSTRNLVAAAAAAGVKHYIALSVVGTDRLASNGYFQGKLAQELLIAGSGLPYTILRATQFFEFLGAIAMGATVGGAVRAPGAGFQPVAAEDVAATLADVAGSAPANGIVDLAGPERAGMDEILGRYLAATGDARRVVTDAAAPYFGSVLAADSLVPTGPARLGAVSLAEWLAAQPARAATV